MKRGESAVEVKIELSDQYKDPYIIIYTNTMTEDIQRIIDVVNTSKTPLIGKKEDKMMILKPEDIYLIRIENSNTVIYTENTKYTSNKRLYELLEQLGNTFMQVNKQVIINLSYINSIEAGFGGTLDLKLKNGIKEYVSRKYLPEFKKYLGL